MEAAREHARQAFIHWEQGEFELAWSCYDESARLFRSINQLELMRTMETKAQQCRSRCTQHSNSTHSSSSSSSAARPPVVAVPVDVPGISETQEDQSGSAVSGSTGAESSTTPNTPHTPGGPNASIASTHMMTSLLATARRSLPRETRPVGEFLDLSKMAIPQNFQVAMARIKYNCHYFRGNYFLIALVIMMYHILTSPWLLVLVCVIVALVVCGVFIENGPMSRVLDWVASLSAGGQTFALALAVFCGIFVLSTSLPPLIISGLISCVVIMCHASTHRINSDGMIQLRDEEDGRGTQTGIEGAENGGGGGGSQDNSACCVCLTNPKDCVLIPCGHVVCRQCGGVLVRGRAGCPVCRARITRANNIFL